MEHEYDRLLPKPYNCSNKTFVCVVVLPEMFIHEVGGSMVDSRTCKPHSKFSDSKAVVDGNALLQVLATYLF